MRSATFKNARDENVPAKRADFFYCDSLYKKKAQWFKLGLILYYYLNFEFQ